MKTKIIFSVVISLFSSFATAQKFSVADVERELVAGASQLNKTLPMWINRTVRLDTSFAGPGLRLTYVATVMNSSPNVPASASDLNPERLKPGICNDTKRRVLLLNGVVFSYMYRREDLKPILTIDINAVDCGFSVYR